LSFQLQNEYLKGVLDGNITEILNILESQKLDLTDLRIKQGITADLVADNQKNISGKNIFLNMIWRPIKVSNTQSFLHIYAERARIETPCVCYS